MEPTHSKISPQDPPTSVERVPAIKLGPGRLIPVQGPSEEMTALDWLKRAVEQIEACGYECEAGKLENNVAWRMIRALAHNVPYQILEIRNPDGSVERMAYEKPIEQG